MGFRCLIVEVCLDDEKSAESVDWEWDDSLSEDGGSEVEEEEDRDEPALDEVSANVELKEVGDEWEWSSRFLVLIEKGDVFERWEDWVGGREADVGEGVGDAKVADNQTRKLELFDVEGFCWVDGLCWVDVNIIEDCSNDGAT